MITCSGCPAGQVAAPNPQDPHSPRPCTVSAPNSCPLGFSCQFSEPNSQFQCCAHKAGCPASSVAFVDSAGQPKLCSSMKPQPLQCPPGFGCLRPHDGNNEICCTLEGGHTELLVTTSTEGPIGPRERERPKDGGKTNGSNSKAGHGQIRGGLPRKKCKPNEQLEKGHCR